MIKAMQLFTNGSVSGFVVLAVVLIFAGSLSGQAPTDSPSAIGLNRPPAVPEGYVVTPFGYFHPTCVLKVKEGETILADGRIEHSDGTVEANAPLCSYPHYTSAGVPLTADMKDASGAIVPIVSGWLEYVSATTSTSYGKISATWPVPPSPGTNEGQILFFFPGFEDINNVLSIVQPVLQYGQSAAGGGNYWAIASWNCCLGGTMWHSRLVKASSGDTILGTIQSSCKRGVPCAKWKVMSQDQTTGKKTVLVRTPADGQVWNWAFGAVLEVYGVKQCSDFPPDNSVVFTVQLYDLNRQLISDPGWAGTPAGSGISPQCNYGLNVTPTQETLQY
jgi:hypothetical protein